MTFFIRLQMNLPHAHPSFCTAVCPRNGTHYTLYDCKPNTAITIAHPLCPGWLTPLVAFTVHFYVVDSFRLIGKIEEYCRLRRASANQPGFFPIQTRVIVLWHSGESGSHRREGRCPAHQHQHRRQPCRHGPHTHHTCLARFSPPLLPFSSPPPFPLP